jgi:hypothetical protein
MSTSPLRRPRRIFLGLAVSAVVAGARPTGGA